MIKRNINIKKILKEKFRKNPEYLTMNNQKIAEKEGFRHTSVAMNIKKLREEYEPKVLEREVLLKRINIAFAKMNKSKKEIMNQIITMWIMNPKTKVTASSFADKKGLQIYSITQIFRIFENQGFLKKTKNEKYNIFEYELSDEFKEFLNKGKMFKKKDK